MTKHQIEVITSVERRRRWSHEDKERLVAACLEPGEVLSEIAVRPVSMSASSSVGASGRGRVTLIGRFFGAIEGVGPLLAGNSLSESYVRPRPGSH